MNRPQYPPSWLKIVTAFFCAVMLAVAVAEDLGLWLMPRWISVPLGFIVMFLVVLVCPVRPEVKLWRRFTFFTAVVLLLLLASAL
jgi:cell division protein FtsW (lipid II flippase)